MTTKPEVIFKQVGNDFFMERNGEFNDSLPPGIYNLAFTPDGRVYFEKITPVTDTLVDVKGSVHEDILDDVARFSTSETKERFKTYGVVHKRGYLLHGPAGTGKTVVAIKAAKRIAEQGGVILFNPPPGALAQVIPVIRKNNENCLIGIIYEEFDDYVHGSSSTLLSVLDGELQVNNFVVIACTNYINRIPGRIKNRPSRFAKVIEVGVPSREFREEFFSKKLASSDQKDLAAFVEASEGFVVDQMKDLIVSVYCMGESLPDAVQKIKGMQGESVGMDDYEESIKSTHFAELKARAITVKPPRLV